MHKNFRTSLWTVALAISSYSVHAQQPANAQLSEVCPLPAPLFDAPTHPITGLPTGAIGVRANRADIDSTTQVASFYGNVEVQLDAQQLRTQQAQINQQTGNINASGATRFTNGYVQVASENFRLNSGENRAFLSGARYQLTATGAHGKADVLSLSPQRVILEGSTFTTCPGDNPAWQMSAQEISLSEDEEWGEAWHAKFELFGLPVLYIPYINFPVTDARKSGFLFPTFRSSQKNGFEVEAPYYINIAPNMDATIAPRYMAERGLQMQGEFRFLSETSEGQYNLAYLENDDSTVDNSARYLWRIEQSHIWGDHWRGYINGTFISDDDYLNDLGSDFAGRADAQLYRHAQLDYLTDDWQVTLRAEDFELLGNYRSPYRTMPQITSHYSHSSPLDLDFTLFSELSHFRNQDDSTDTATRVHLEPQLRYHLEHPGFDWLAELSYAYTYYDQEQNLATGLTANPTRSLPTFRWRGRVNLERSVEIGDEAYLHTLQPQIQYLYTPYRDQSGIGIYDSTLMQDDYQGLFRARRFSGLDRIADANQATVGVSTSLFDNQARELARVSFGQIYYFENSQTQLLESADENLASRSDLALETRFRINNNMYFNSSIQYNLELHRTRKSQTTIEYRKDEFNLIQFSHRTVTNLLEEDVEQVGMIGVVELSPRWQMASNWYYDLANSRTNDALIALQYSDCCWAMRISGYRRINRNLEFNTGLPQVGAPEFDNGVSIQFIIKGLGSDNRSLLDLLEQSLFGYRHPFHLSN
ncbi:LPS-assembly protein LptD [Pseudidiomarina gelatinasegens]|uniref:LPS-assembly protein LptD n=1 Tax=Pseudidiomarina gelatinasegens TaxID=2487740 RepID=A0A443YY95_9GAMM|nr:LPS assembly protein LptD [Pseudidiomarina gelatinasegens]RWU09028.1 LPS-assembly protein LptD [Pseudidiomarina gelatinasegens]